jgi:hypothetical protein
MRCGTGGFTPPVAFDCGRAALCSFVILRALMKITRDFVIQNLADSGLMSADDASSLCESLSSLSGPADSDTVAQELSGTDKLTAYQAECVCRGESTGLVFGDYVVLDKIGQGGMGVVLKAQHTRMERIVAVKKLNAEALQSEDLVKRFYREVKASARLLHPNVVTALDAREHEGVHYLIMEYMVCGLVWSGLLPQVADERSERSLRRRHPRASRRGRVLAPKRGVLPVGVSVRRLAGSPVWRPRPPAGLQYPVHAGNQARRTCGFFIETTCRAAPCDRPGWRVTANGRRCSGTCHRVAGRSAPMGASARCARARHRSVRRSPGQRAPTGLG